MLNKNEVLENALNGARELMERFTPEELPPSNRFHYHQGVFLSGVEQLYALTGEEKLNDYIRAWLNYNIESDGTAPRCFLGEFDDLQPSVLVFNQYRQTGDKRYELWLDRLMDIIEPWPTNAQGGVWHKFRNKNQMWLDTMYMMGLITTKLAMEWNNEYLVYKVHHQMKLMRDNMTNPKTGLLYHMWDDSKENQFVDKTDGLVKVHWGRAMGWYVVAMFEIAEEIGIDHPLYQDFIDTGVKYLEAVYKYQDKETGLFYQVLDYVDDDRNWLETSCTALFVEACAKAYRMGAIDDSYLEMIEKGYRGVMSKTETKDNKLYLSGVCVGTGVGDLQAYFDRPTVTNDLHGMGAFLLMSAEVAKIL